MSRNYHFIAVGGAVMHNLALALHDAGHHVTGSDDEIYNPARDRLDRAGILPKEEGWFPERIHADLDGVILGMHARPGNPELARARELNLPIYSFPEFIYEQSKTKRRIAICGSHGKTTTTAMLLHALAKRGVDTDYLVGAQLDGFDRMVRLSDAPNILIEGDEYLSSPLDRRPKFVHYRAEVAVLTGIAWDHMNVFPTYEDYFQQFELLLDSLAPNATLIYNEEDAEVRRLIAANARKDLTLLPYRGYAWARTDSGKTQAQDVEFEIFGNHNFSNLAAAVQVGRQLGVSEADFLRAMTDFQGAAKRLQSLASRPGFDAWLDFAHAPSKVRATVQAVRDLYPERNLIAVFELHTYSSLNADFLPNYRDSLAPADAAAVFFNQKTLEIKKMQPLTARQIQSGFDRADLAVFTSAESLENWLKTQIEAESCVLLMSSGTFGGSSFDFA